MNAFKNKRKSITIFAESSIILLAMALMASCGSGRVSVSDSIVKSKGANVAILGFDMRNKKNNAPMPRVNEVFSEALVPSLMDAGFKVIERKKIDLLLKEAEFQESGLVDSEKAVKLGKIAQVRFVVYGSGMVNPAASKGTVFLHSISVKMVDVETGETALAANWSGAGVRPPDVADKIGKEIVKKINEATQRKP